MDILTGSDSDYINFDAFPRHGQFFKIQIEIKRICIKSFLPVHIMKINVNPDQK